MRVIWQAALSLIVVLCLVLSVHASKEEEALVDDHPDPNKEDYEGMIYVGRMDHTDSSSSPRRLSAHHDNTVRLLFGTSFDEAHKEIAQEDLRHRESGSQHYEDLASRGRTTKTRQQVIQEHMHKPVRPEPVPHGHVETHPLDGGITPVTAIAVEPFFLDATPVTNAAFAKFVRATYYQTEAELYGWSFCLSSFVPNSTTHPSDWEVDPEAMHWVAVPGATWRTPEGPGSSYKHREQHPVVHVSHRDAAEYCTWRGNFRLAGEREYEAAARTTYTGPTNRTLYAWGDEANWTLAAKHANLWGSDRPEDFPNINHAADGWRGTSPVKTYPPNEWGFYDLTGNVWEWMRGGKHKNRIVRGASYVDSLDGNVNHAATLGARSTLHGTTTTGNLGFRCAKTPARRIEHEYVPVRKDNDDDDDGDEDEEPEMQKVVKKRERIYTEL